jgi:hypothetical protein
VIEKDEREIVASCWIHVKVMESIEYENEEM